MHKIVIDFLIQTPVITWAIICFVLWVLEVLWDSSQNQSVRSKVLNMSNGFFVGVSIFMMPPLIGLLTYAVGNHIGGGFIDLRFFPHYDILSQALSVLILMFIQDFFYYFYHRTVHKVPFLWDIHAVHHSETEMNVTTTLRRHWLETSLQEITVALPVAMLFRLTPVEMTGVVFGQAAFVFLAHSSLRLQLGRYSWLFTSPQLHRLHHSHLKAHWDSNYAQVFPVIDKIFGTYVAPHWNEFPPTGLSPSERIETLSDMLLWPFKKWFGRVFGNSRKPAVPE